MNGCGAYIVMSMDKDDSTAAWHLTTESWLALRDDYYDATGNAGSSLEMVCNYDCVAHPFTL